MPCFHVLRHFARLTKLLRKRFAALETSKEKLVFKRHHGIFPWLGVAVEEDIYKEAREQIEQELAHREAVETATRLLNEILEGVRTPERARSPVDAYITVGW